MRTLLLFSALAVFIAAPALAAGKPPEIAPVIKSAEPYGRAEFHKVFWHVYDAQLWTDAPQWSYAAPFALSLTYHVEIDKNDIATRTIDEMEKIHPLDEAQKKEYLADLESAFINVKDGDRITAVYLPGRGMVFYGDGRRTAAFNSPQFAKQFFDIWLSDKTSEPSLRNRLLAGRE